MPPLRFALVVLGLVLFGCTTGLVGYDIFIAVQVRRLLPRKPRRAMESGQVKACAIGIR